MTNEVSRILNCLEEFARTKQLEEMLYTALKESCFFPQDESGGFRVVLTDEHLQQLKDAEFDAEKFKNILRCIKRLASSNSLEDVERVNLRRLILALYQQGKYKTIEQLLAEQNSSEIAKRYSDLRSHVDVAALIQMNTLL